MFLVKRETYIRIPQIWKTQSAWVFGRADGVLEKLREYLSAPSTDPCSPPFDVETLLQTGDGEYLWFRVRGQALWNKEGIPTRMAGSITDITERRKWEEEQSRLIANLDIARDKAEKAAKARSEFLAVSIYPFSVHSSRAPFVWVESIQWRPLGSSTSPLSPYPERMVDVHPFTSGTIYTLLDTGQRWHALGLVIPQRCCWNRTQLCVRVYD